MAENPARAGDVHRNDSGESVADPPLPHDHLTARELLDALVDRARVRIRWVGAGRLLGGAGAAIVIAGLGWWLMRSPALPTEAALPIATHAGDRVVDDQHRSHSPSAAARHQRRPGDRARSRRRCREPAGGLRAGGRRAGRRCRRGGGWSDRRGRPERAQPRRTGHRRRPGRGPDRGFSPAAGRIRHGTQSRHGGRISRRERPPVPSTSTRRRRVSSKHCPGSVRRPPRRSSSTARTAGPSAGSTTCSTSRASARPSSTRSATRSRRDTGAVRAASGR